VFSIYGLRQSGAELLFYSQTNRHYLWLKESHYSVFPVGVYYCTRAVFGEGKGREGKGRGRDGTVIGQRRFLISNGMFSHHMFWDMMR
jgi:hypothetical protein